MTTLHKLRFLIILVLATITHSFSQSRGMTVEDLFRIEDFSEVAIDPSGKYVAYVIKRSKQPNEYYQRDYLDHNGRADIWLYDIENDNTFNLTKGKEKAEGFWNPVWSPDGNYLAMVSTQGNDNVRVLVWETGTDILKRVSDFGLNTRTKAYGKSTPSRFMDPLIWVSNEELVFQILGAGQVSFNFELKNRAQRKVLETWPKAERGYEVTSHTIESGIPIGADVFKKGRVIKVNIRENSTDTLAKGYFYHLISNKEKNQLLMQKKEQLKVPGIDKKLAYGALDDLKLGIGDLKTMRTHWLNIDGPRSISSHKWSPSGSYIAIKKQADNEDSGYVIYNLRSGKNIDMNAVRVWWLENDILLVQDASESLVRYDPDSGKPMKKYNLNAPDKVYVLDENKTLFLSNKAFHVFNPKRGTLRRLTPKQFEIQRVLSSATNGSFLVIGRNNDDPYKYYTVDVKNLNAVARVNRVVPPEDGLVYSAFDTRNKIGVYRQRNDQGTFLWLSKNGTFTKIKAINTFVSQIDPGKNEIMEYVGADGNKLKAIVHYPSNYNPNKKYPVVVWVYMGSTVNTPNSWLLNKQKSIYINLLPLAEQGYILLIPSMPNSDSKYAKDDYMEMHKGVLPAVNALIERDNVDEERIAIGGQSYGGYSVFSLLTQTNRFKTAFSLSGPTDLLSLYGKTDVRFRYADLPYEHTFNPRSLETGQESIGGTPWTLTWKYLRNSPYYYADRIETPVLIIQGDLDFVPIEQGESIFMALYRQGKRARFVRYWGEGHEFMSPANITDMWQHIFTWLEESMD